MKTAVSLPKVIFHEAERQARRMKKSRSRLYGEALAEYLARHAADRVEEALNNLCDELQPDERRDSFVSEASRRTLVNSEW